MITIRRFPSAGGFSQLRSRFCGEAHTKQTEDTRAGHLRGLAREAHKALVLERAQADEDFALWLDARLLAASGPREAGT